MRPNITRRNAITGACAAALALSASIESSQTAVAKPAANTQNFVNVMNDLYGHYWSSGAGNSSGHVNTCNSGYTSDPNHSAYYYAQRSGFAGAQNVANWNNGRPDLWIQSQFVHLMYWYWRKNTSQDSGVRVQNHFPWLNTQFSSSQLQDASPNSLIVAASDDAAWILNMYMDMYDVGISNALSYAMNLANSTYQYYTPQSGQVPTNGLVYALPGSGLYNQHPNVSSIYEVGIAIACLRIYSATVSAGAADQGWFNRASTSYQWMTTKLLNANNNLLFTELHLDSGQPVQYTGSNTPAKGASDYFMNGMIGVAVLAARLYGITNQSKYLNDARRFTNAVLNNFVETDPQLNFQVLLNARDPWTDGFYLAEWVNTVKPLLVNPNRMNVLLSNTATSILTHSRTSDGFYTADWVSGTYWSDQCRQNSFAGMAAAEQMQTSSTTAAILLANAMANG